MKFPRWLAIVALVAEALLAVTVPTKIDRHVSPRPAAQPQAAAPPLPSSPPQTPVLIPTPAPPAPKTVHYGKPELIWSDEFNGDQLDSRCWTPETTRPGNNADELQRFTASAKNLSVHDGSLWISAYPEATGSGADKRDYTSAQITTMNNGFWTYGYYEARIKAPKGAGAFPAFWLMPQYSEWGPWPNSGEIDIWEYIGRDENIAYAALHFTGADWHGGYLRLPTALHRDYHIYGFEWLPHRMRWYVDHKLIWEKNAWLSPDPKRRLAPFDSPFYVILNLSLGGKWPRPPNAATQFPLQLAVDYVRVYKIPGATDPEHRPPYKPSGPHSCPLHGPGGAHAGAP